MMYGENKSVDEVCEMIRAAVAAVSGCTVDAVHPDRSFHRCGLDSVGAVAVARELTDRLGSRVSPVLLWSHPSPRQLAERLTSPRVEQMSDPVLAAGSESDDDPLAVVGIACRFPGAVHQDAFRDLLESGTDVVGPVPDGRPELYPLRDPALPPAVRYGSFLDDVGEFDPGCFDLSPREAAAMDPQQRLLLELGREALQDAGIVLSALRGRLVGVFVGAMWSDYATLQRGGLAEVAQHAAVGLHRSVLANRLSHVFDLRGPSLTVDTACSSSLVALHLAAESIRAGESELAVVGGVNVALSPRSVMWTERFGALSPSGACRTFDAAADGFVRGDGAGMVVLAPLTEALARGYQVHALMLSSAINNDGHSNGLTAPNPEAQRDVLRRAWARAGRDPARAQYVELHGTGTRLGDPIEAHALGAVFGPGREMPLRVGSVKTNMGHLEGAAGIAGLIKLVIGVRTGMLTPSLHFDTPNPEIPLDELNLRVQTRTEPWCSGGEPRLGGVSSFGFGGTNAHAVVAQWPERVGSVLPLAAASEPALRDRAAQVLAGGDCAWPKAARSWRSRAAGGRSTGIVAHVAATRCSPGLPAADSTGCFRLAVTGSDTTQMAALRAFVAGEDHPELHLGPPVTTAPGVVLVCGGHGGHWPGMGRSLLQHSPVFRAELARCEPVVRRHLGWSLLEEITATGSRSRLDELEFGLAASVGVQIGLAADWRSRGVTPNAVIGQSAGEVVAAHLAGVLDLDDTFRIIAAQGRIPQRRLRGRGGLAAVGLSWAQTTDVLIEHPQLAAAIQHSATTTVVAGPDDALDRFIAAMTVANVFCRRVAIDVPTHSPMMDEVRAQMRAQMGLVRARPARIPLASEVDVELIDGVAPEPEHWVRNACDPVRFADAVELLLDRGHDTFLELTPHPLLQRSIRTGMTERGRDGVVIASMRRDEDASTTLADATARLWVRGVDVRARAEPVRRRSVFVLSGRSEAGLDGLAAGLRHHLSERPELEAADVAQTLARRGDGEHRAAILAGDTAELRAHLAEIRDGRPTPRIVRGQTSYPGRLAFVFSGQGAQRARMGADLAARHPEFADAWYTTLTAVSTALGDAPGPPLVEVLKAEPGTTSATLLDQTWYTQPALFAFQVALCRLLDAWGVRPDLLLGHSVGEIAAAHVTGALSLDDTARLIARRAQLMQRLPAGGAMLSVTAAADDVADQIAEYRGRLDIAAVNGPAATVLSGDHDAVDAAAAVLGGRGHRVRRLVVSHAFHSARMDPMLDEFVAAIGDLGQGDATIPLVSTVDGCVASIEQLATAGYWARHARRTVRFADGIAALTAAGATRFLEIGPRATLTSLIPACVPETTGPPAVVVPTGPAAASTSDEADALLTAIASLYVTGTDVRWESVLLPGRVITLPVTAYERSRYWHGDPADAPAGSSRAPVPVAEPEPATTTTTTWSDRLRAMRPPDRRTVLLEHVLAHAAEVLGHPNPRTVHPDQQFQRLGLDSTMAVSLTRRIGADLNLKLPSVLLYDHPSANALVEYLDTVLSEPGTPVEPADLTAPDRRPDPITELQTEPQTDDELFRLLDDQLGGNDR